MTPWIAPDRSFASHPYASFLHEVERPARYAGGEHGEVRKDWARTRVRVCLAFPDLYDIGMSHMGTRILYARLNAQPDALCERAFAPWLDMEAELRRRALPLVSLESARPLGEFDVVGLSLQHELVFTSCLTILDLAGIPLRASERAEGDPLVLGGGSVASHPEPVAPFFDALVVGDGERLALEVARRWVGDREDGLDRAARLRRLAALGGVYVPSLYETRLDERSNRQVVARAVSPEAPLPVSRAFVADLDDYPYPDSFPIGGPEAVFERVSFEVSRGCNQGCRFCQAGMILRPERERDPAALLETIERAVRASGADEVSLASLSTADYSHLGPLVRELARRLEPRHVALGLSSLRAYGLGDEVLDDIRRVRAPGLTFAPEAGTQRLRDVVNKNVTDEQVVEAAARALGRGWDRVKLYFMIGLPTETDADVAAIVETCVRARAAGRRARPKGRPIRLTAAVSTFVPKPHTPLQWAAMDGLDRVVEKHALLRREAASHGLEVRTHEPQASVLEGMLSRGDRRLAAVLELAWRAGARFDAWEGRVRWDAWTQALERCGLRLEELLGELPVGAALPWSHIEMGLEPGFLERERDRALRARLTPPCAKPAARPPDGRDTPGAEAPQKLVCVQCGLECDLVALADRRAEAARRLEAACSASRLATESPATPQAPLRYRMRFEKLGRAALLGHLDLVRELPRILRRAGAELLYSRGFHPKPSMAFGPALALGVPSFDEYVDVKLAAPMGPDQLVREASRASPSGIRFLAAARLDPAEPPIGKLVARCRYLVGLPRERWESAGGRAELAVRIEKLLGAEAVRVTRRVDASHTREIDARPHVISIEPGGEEGAARFVDAGIPGDFFALAVELRVLPSGAVRPAEVVAAMLGEAAVPVRAIRIAQLRAGGEPVMPEARGPKPEA